MLFVENDAVLVVINVRAILHEEILSAEFYRDDTVILPCRMVESAGVSFILRAEQALRISRSLCFTGSSYCLRVFLRLGQIYSYIYSSVLCFYSPLAVLCDTISSDVIRISGKAILHICRFIW